MNKTFVAAGPVKASLLLLLLAGAPALVAAQAEVPSATGLGNPLHRNPVNRRGLSDAAPVEQDPRNSTTRPTLPAAPTTSDARDVPPPAPDAPRDSTPTVPQLAPVAR